jgi:hypothetical protein
MLSTSTKKQPNGRSSRVAARSSRAMVVELEGRRASRLFRIGDAARPPLRLPDRHDVKAKRDGAGSNRHHALDF